MTVKAHLVGLGSYLPSKVLSNKDLEAIVETSDEWIVSRTGIRERRIAAENEFPSNMGTEAAKKALISAKMKIEDIDLIIVATMTGDYPSPSTAGIIQQQLGAVNAAAFDIQAACTGFIYGLSTAKAYIESGLYRTILLIATEKMSSVINYKDRNTCVLFGDGAGAAIISGEARGLRIDAVSIGADGQHAGLITIPGGGSRHPMTHEMVDAGLQYFSMNGKEVFKHAVRRMSAASKECLEKMRLSKEAVDWVIPHQANIRIMDAICKSLEIPLEKMYRTVDKYGNTCASSIIIALAELINEQPINPEHRLLLVAFGGGLTWGASLLTCVSSINNS